MTSVSKYLTANAVHICDCHKYEQKKLKVNALGALFFINNLVLSILCFACKVREV